ncbi:MAG: hypothetical protein N2C14_21800 [Planctomycetales bacterium]
MSKIPVLVNFFPSQPLTADVVAKYGFEAPGVYALIVPKGDSGEWAFVGATRLSLKEELQQLLDGSGDPGLAELIQQGKVRFCNSVLRAWDEAEAAQSLLIDEFAPTLNQSAAGSESSNYELNLRLAGDDPYRPASVGKSSAKSD